MNNDLIRRETLYFAVRNVKKTAELFSNDDYRIGYISALSLIEGILADAPAVDAEPVKHGIWEPDCWRFECSLCHKYFNLDECYSGEATAEMNYCPHCGARMDGRVKVEND